jgi:hypothetical protein
MVVVTQIMVVMLVFTLCSIFGLFKHFEWMQCLHLHGDKIWFRRMLQWLGGTKYVSYTGKFQEIVMEGGRKDRNELSQWQLRIPSEVNGLSAPFCSLNRHMLPQTSLYNWHILFLTFNWRKYIHQNKKGGGSKFLWKIKQTLQNEQHLFITNITHMMDVISVWNNWCMSPYTSNGAGRTMIEIILK